MWRSSTIWPLALRQSRGAGEAQEHVDGVAVYTVGLLRKMFHLLHCAIMDVMR